MRRTVVGVSAAVLLVAAAGAFALWFTNNRLLPRGFDALKERAEASGPLRVRVDSVSYRPLRGLRLRQVEATESTGRFALAADIVDIEVSLGTLVRMARVARGRVSLPRPAVADDAERAVDGGAARGDPATATYHRIAMTAAEQLSTLAAAGLMPTSVTARGVGVTLGTASLVSPLSLSFDSATVLHDSSQKVVEISLQGAGPPEVNVHLETDYAHRLASASIESSDIAVPAMERPGMRITNARLSTNLSVELSENGCIATRGRIEAVDMSVEAAVMAAEAIAPLDVVLAFDADFDPDAPNPDIPPVTAYAIRRHFPGGVLRVHEGQLRINGVDLLVSGVVSGTGTKEAHPVSRAPAGIPRRIAMMVQLPNTPVSRINEAVPAALKGPLTSLDVSGTFAWQVYFDFPRYNPLGVTWTADTELQDFAVAHIARAVSPFGLNGAFVHTIRDPEVGYHRQVSIPAFVPRVRNGEETEGPRAPARATAAAPGGPTPHAGYVYRRLDEISPMVIAAVLAAEDGAFYYHRGVNFRTLSNAIVRNISEGDVVVGASTITMQLAKMLFLSDDRVLSRKLQEVFLVYLMEHEVPVSKDRILEIYLNIAEFGPGVFGIHDAARYYFATDARELSAGEATFLASILPAPKRYHWYYDRGEITDGWFIRMKSYYDIMLRQGQLTQEEYDEAVSHKPQFATRAAAPEPSEPPAL